jgi:hypothetical protein
LLVIHSDLAIKNECAEAQGFDGVGQLEEASSVVLTLGAETSAKRPAEER